MSTISSKKPLTYESRHYVLRELSFLKRKELSHRCPSLRNQEQRIGYRINELTIDESRKSCQIDVDELAVQFLQKSDTDFLVTMWIATKGKVFEREYNGTDENRQDAAERWILNSLGRSGTKIRSLKLDGAAKCILKCPPMTVFNLIVENLQQPPENFSSWIKTTQPIEHVSTNIIIRDESIKTARSVTIVATEYVENITPMYEWEAQRILVLCLFQAEHILGYSKHIAETGGRPIGFKIESKYPSSNLECIKLDWMAFKLNARKTFWNGRKCFTIPLDEFSELNGHGNLDNYSDHFILEVNPKGTAVERGGSK